MGRSRHTDIVSQRPYMKETDIALRDVETMSKQPMSQVGSYKQRPIQEKVQHTSLPILAATKNNV